MLELGEQARRFEKSIVPGREADTSWDVADLAAHVIDAARIDHPEADIAANLPGEALARAPGTLELALTELIENATGVDAHSSGSSFHSVATASSS